MSEKPAEDANISDENQEQLENVQPKISAAEEKARSDGWMPEKEWDGDENEKPKEFLTAEMFNARGEFIGRLKAQDKRMNELETEVQSFNTRMNNANKLHQQQMEVQKTDLERKRDDAIDLADRDAANGYQKDIDKLNQQPVESVPISNAQTVLDNWNAANPWIIGSDPKAAYAKQQFNMYQHQGMDINIAITNTENDVNRAFPALNSSREPATRPPLVACIAGIVSAPVLPRATFVFGFGPGFFLWFISSLMIHS